jgi:serine phosphatase RsbU (regulator of sigma subunit)
MKELEYELNNVLFDAYYEKNRYKKALEYFKNYIEKKDSAFLTTNRRQYAILTRKIKEKEKEIKVKDSTIIVIDSTLGEVEDERDTLKVETARKGKQIEKLNYEKAYQEKVIQNQRLQLYFLIVGVLLVIIIAIVLLRLYIFKKKANIMLKAKNEEILQQKEEIETQRDHIEVQNQHITDSIVYAQRIQQAALPDEKIINEVGIDHFILFKPRDIVSGDFYWMKRVGDNVIIVAADCTGHGVPGAFVSMLGMSFLNDIIPNKRFNLKASEILEKLRLKVKSSLKQTGRDSESKDGMDIAICVINQEEQIMQYAGAHNPLYHIRNGQLNVIKATRNPIGVFFKEFPFENHKIELKEGDQFYIFSDGYVDQFGGENRKKFSSKRFKNLILDIHDKDMNAQKETLDKTIEEWKKCTSEQIDDILVVGFKI